MIKRAIMIKKLRAAALNKKKKRIRQTLDRFHVIATLANLANTPHDTAGWTATLTRTGITPITANFDDFGVARFATVTTLTTVSYTLTIRNENDVVLFTRTVPADREVFVARFSLPV